MKTMVLSIVEKLGNVQPEAGKESIRVEKIAVPVVNGMLSSHFGHCEQFLFASSDGKQVTGTEMLVPPPHEPGVIPEWLHKQGATVVLVGGMGERAQQILNSRGIKVICGVHPQTPIEIVNQYLAGKLTGGENACNHDGEEHHGCGH